MTATPAREAWQEGRAALERHGIPQAAREARDLLAYILNLPPHQLPAYMVELELSSTDWQTYQELLKRRCQSEPFHYLIGRVPFLEHELYIGPGALIPRPETEALAALILDEVQPFQNMRVLDLCCGSGCLGLSLKAQWPQISLSLADISQKALDICAINRDRLHLQCQILQSDLGSALEGSWDLIVCNPPYLSHREMDTIEPDVLHYEPHLALFCGQNGLFLPKRCLDYAARALNPEGILFMETGPEQHNALGEHAQTLDLRGEGRKDFHGKPRYMTFSRSSAWH